MNHPNVHMHCIIIFNNIYYLSNSNTRKCYTILILSKENLQFIYVHFKSCPNQEIHVLCKHVCLFIVKANVTLYVFVYSYIHTLYFYVTFILGIISVKIINLFHFHDFFSDFVPNESGE